jgi:hypothetical protein
LLGLTEQSHDFSRCPIGTAAGRMNQIVHSNASPYA